MWPDLCQVEWVDAIGLGRFLRHDLYTDSPFGKVALGDSVEKIVLGIVRILPSHLVRLLTCEILDALLRLEVPLHVEQLVFGIDERSEERRVGICCRFGWGGDMCILE